MSDTKVLQAILDGQKDIKNEIKKNREGIEANGKRIDKLGLELAELSDDAPTNKEFEEYKEKVDKLETQFASN